MDYHQVQLELFQIARAVEAMKLGECIEIRFDSSHTVEDRIETIRLLEGATGYKIKTSEGNANQPFVAWCEIPE